MASSPLYGDRPGLQGFRRSSSSFTAPHRQLSHHERAGLDQSDADADLLYKHPSARIISFSPPTDSIVSKSRDTHGDADYPIDTIETLPWRSRTENLLAAGPLVIEKVKGSVNFLKCHQVVHSILRNSQCWCVDGESKFVLRKGKLQYYRIELPNTSEEDKAKVEELKQVFGRLLKFEKTPCPFIRAFQVDLADDAITPRRKGKWTKRESLPTTPESSTPPLRRTKNFRSWSMQAGPAERPNGQSPLQRDASYDADSSYARSPLANSDRLNARPDTPSSMGSTDVAGHGMNDEGYDSDSSTGEADQSRSKTLSMNDLSSQSTTEAEEENNQAPNSSLERDPKATSTEDTAITTQAQEGPSDDTADSTAYIPEEVNTSSASYAAAEGMMESSSDTSLFTKLMEDVSRQVPSESDVDESMPPIVPGSDEATQDPSSEPSVLSDIDFRKEKMPQIPMPATDEAEDAPAPSQSELCVVEASPTIPDPTEDTADDARSIASAAESFYTVDSVDEGLHPIPLYTAGDLEITPLAEDHDPLAARKHQHRRDVSEVTITADSFESSEDLNNPSTRMQYGMRQRLAPQRSLSPPPPPETVFSPPRQNHGNHLTADLLQKATRLALVKPIEVMVLVVHILARIAGGASLNDLLSGNLFKKPEQHRRTSSFPDRLGSQDDDEEDDFGVPIRGRTTSTNKMAPDFTENGHDTDADSMFELD